MSTKRGRQTEQRETGNPVAAQPGSVDAKEASWGTVSRFLGLAAMIAIVIGAGFGLFRRCTTRPLTVDEVMDEREERTGRTITVHGIVGLRYLHCTEAACDPDNPCCNACFGGLGLFPSADAFYRDPPRDSPFDYHGGWPVIALTFPDGGGCTGNNCEMTCEPLQPGERYVITGVLVECHRVNPDCTLDVESFEHE